MSKKEVNLPTEKEVVVPLNNFLAQAEELKKKFNWSDEKLDAMLVHVDEKEVVAGAKKTCTQIRTAIAAAHKDAKAPFLPLTKALDAAKREAEAAIKKIEAPLDAAIKRRKEKDAQDAAKAKDDRIAELEARLAVAEGAAQSDGIEIAEFEEKTITMSVGTRAQVSALKRLLGDAYNDVAHGPKGEVYNLTVLVKRESLAE